MVHLIAAREPRPVAAGRLVIASANQGRDLAIDYAHADFDARIEERRIDHPQLTATWGPCVYRIALAARDPAAQGVVQVEVSVA